MAACPCALDDDSRVETLAARGCLPPCKIAFVKCSPISASPTNKSIESFVFIFYSSPLAECWPGVFILSCEDQLHLGSMWLLTFMGWDDLSNKLVSSRMIEQYQMAPPGALGIVLSQSVLVRNPTWHAPWGSNGVWHQILTLFGAWRVTWVVTHLGTKISIITSLPHPPPPFPSKACLLYA